MNNKPEELWEEYRKTVYPGESLSHIQERELRMAFFAGMEETFRVVLKLADCGTDEEMNDLMDRFRHDIMDTAMKTNLDRADGMS